MGLCKSDSWAPPVSLLRAASRDPNGQPTATQALPLLRLSLLLVSGLAIGWFTLLVSCLSSSVLFRLVSLHSLVSRHAPSLCSSSRTIDRLNHDCRRVRIYYRRPFLSNDQSRIPVHLIISLKRPCRVLTRRTINTSFLPPHTQLVFVSSTCLEKVPGSWIEVLTTLAFCRLRR